MSAFASVSSWSSYASVAEPVNGEKFDEYVWIVVCAGLAAFFMAWGIGANDVANSFATSVGSRTLKLWQAVIVAGVFEFAGAVGLGNATAKTVASDISNVSLYTAVPEIYMYGMLCSLTIAGVWLLFATYFRMAVSTTHSIIGSIMGFSLVFGGFQDGVLWDKRTGNFPYSKGFLKIVLSWFFSPIIGAILSSSFFLFSRTLVLRRENSTNKAIWLLPVLLFFTFFINLMFVLAKGAKGEMLKTYPCFKDIGRGGLKFTNCEDMYAAAVWIAACAAFGIAIIGGSFGIWFLRRKFTTEELTNEKASMEAHIDAKAADVPELEEGSAERKKTKHGSNDDIFKIPPVPPGLLARIPYFAMLPFIAFYMQCKKGLFYDIHDKDMEMDEVTHELHAGAEVFHPNAEKVYEVLQVVSACCVAFAHGSNDVANAMGPFSAIYSVYTTHSIPGSKSEAPRWIFVIGGFGIILGLLMYGYNIIGHLGTHLIHLTPSRGFSAELAAGMTISLASFFGIPVSTTQIIVGSEVGVGLCEWRKGSIGWSVLGYTCLGWIWTILLGATMCAALFSAGVYAPSLPMSQDLAYYRKQLLMTQDATLTAMSTNNNEWINDAQWWSGAVVLPMTANGSALVTKISDLQDSYAGLRSPETYVGPDQVMWNFASGMEMADNYALSAIGQNDKGSVMDGTTALRFP